METQVLITIGAAIFGSSGFWLIIQKIIESKSAMRRMVLGIGYERLTSACKKHIQAGWIPLDELEELEHRLYKPYKDMGGNGSGDIFFNKVKELPNRPPEALS